MTKDERLKRLHDWLDRMSEEMFAMVTDDDTYWRFQHDVLQKNHRLLQMRSPFFDLLNSSYVQAAASTIRRLTEKQNSSKTNVSLRIVIDEIRTYPEILTNPPRIQIDRDIELLDDVENKIRPYVDRVVAHHDRRPVNPIPKWGDLRHSVRVLNDLFRKYYALVMKTDRDFKVSYLHDFEIFTFAWKPSKTSRSR